MFGYVRPSLAKLSEEDKARFGAVYCGLCRALGERYGQAAYWYTLALACPRDDRRGGFVSPDCYGYLPCIQLCVCYSRLGNQKKAEAFNELAAACKPDSPAVRHNRAVFQALSEETA